MSHGLDISLFLYIPGQILEYDPLSYKLCFLLFLFFLCASRPFHFLLHSFTSCSRFIMTSTPSQLGPLHFLASVISDIDNDKSSGKHSPSADESSNPGSSSPISETSPTPFLQNMVNLHVPYRSTKAHQPVGPRVLRHSTSSNHLQSSDTSFVPFIRHKSARRARKAVESNLTNRIQMKKRRKELMDKATKIKSLDNSPVNERQLLVLRMVYDEITMYPCESWMVLIAIIINRSVSKTAYPLS